MKIRTALTLKYTCITATIFLLCMVLIYLVSEHTRDQTFFRNLKKRRHYQGQSLPGRTGRCQDHAVGLSEQ